MRPRAQAFGRPRGGAVWGERAARRCVRLLPVCWAQEGSLRPVRRLLGAAGWGPRASRRGVRSTVRGACGDQPWSLAADSAPQAHWGPGEAGTPRRPPDGALWTLGSLASAGGREKPGETGVLSIKDRWGHWERRPETPGCASRGHDAGRTGPGGSGLRRASESPSTKCQPLMGGSSVRGGSPDSGYWSGLPVPPSRKKFPERKPGRAGARGSPATEEHEPHQEQRPERGQQVHQPEREGRVLAATVYGTRGGLETSGGARDAASLRVWGLRGAPRSAMHAADISHLRPPPGATQESFPSRQNTTTQRLPPPLTTRWSLAHKMGLPCGRPGLGPWVRKIPLEKGMAIHSSVLAWRIPWIQGAARATGIPWAGVSHVKHPHRLACGVLGAPLLQPLNLIYGHQGFFTSLWIFFLMH